MEKARKGGIYCQITLGWRDLIRPKPKAIRCHMGSEGIQIRFTSNSGNWSKTNCSTQLAQLAIAGGVDGDCERNQNTLFSSQLGLVVV